MQDPPRVKRSPPIGKRSQPRILVVETDEEITRQITATLEGLGYEVASASDPELALEEARTLRPDLGILDVRLQAPADRPHPGQVLHEELNIPVVFLDSLAAANTFEKPNEVRLAELPVEVSGGMAQVNIPKQAVVALDLQMG